MSDSWAVGTRVTRDLEGMDFPACISADKGDGSYDIVYTDDGNTEEDVPGDELRLDENAGGETVVAESKEALMKNWLSPAKSPNKNTAGFDILNDFNSTQNLNALKAPKVIIHQIEHANSPAQQDSPGDGRSRGARPNTSRSHKKAAASAFIINGPETNFAAGRGIRGIRWLRDNPNSY